MASSGFFHHFVLVNHGNHAHAILALRALEEIGVQCTQTGRWGQDLEFAVELGVEPGAEDDGVVGGDSPLSRPSPAKLLHDPDGVGVPSFGSFGQLALNLPHRILNHGKLIGIKTRLGPERLQHHHATDVIVRFDGRDRLLNIAANRVLGLTRIGSGSGRACGRLDLERFFQFLGADRILLRAPDQGQANHDHDRQRASNSHFDIADASGR